MEKTLRVKPRYYRWHVDPKVEWVEKNTGYAELDWEIPISQAALVLVDVWDRHYLKDTAARAEEIIQRKIRPLVHVCRQAGLQIIHAPSPGMAKAHPAWVRLVSEEEMSGGQGDDWPPAEFRRKSGDYKKYAQPSEPRGILFLFYLGFNTNACILLRDYGTLEMSKRGYEIIIVRDCTTGMESFETHDELWQTRGAILFLEMFTRFTNAFGLWFGKYSITSEYLISGLP